MEGLFPPLSVIDPYLSSAADARVGQMRLALKKGGESDDEGFGGKYSSPGGKGRKPGAPGVPKGGRTPGKSPRGDAKHFKETSADAIAQARRLNQHRDEAERAPLEGDLRAHTWLDGGSYMSSLGGDNFGNSLIEAGTKEVGKSGGKKKGGKKTKRVEKTENLMGKGMLPSAKAVTSTTKKVDTKKVYGSETQDAFFHRAVDSLAAIKLHDYAVKQQTKGDKFRIWEEIKVYQKENESAGLQLAYDKVHNRPARAVAGPTPTNATTTTTAMYDYYYYYYYLPCISSNTCWRRGRSGTSWRW